MMAAKERYDKMKYNRCGNSGLYLPAISLGLWHNFGDVDDFANCRNIAVTAFDLGVTHFDLANNYGPPGGSAESNFAKILKTDLAGFRDELIISTKAGHGMWDGPYGNGGSKKSMIASLDQSLKRLKLDYVDIYYSHRPDPDTPMEETMDALDLAVRQGKTLYAGISSYSSEQTREACEILAGLNNKCLIHQPCYSMFYREIEADLLDTLEDVGVGCIAFSPLAQGLLTDKYLKGVPESSRAANVNGCLNRQDITAERLSIIKGLNEIACDRGQSLAQMALAWILKDKRITSVVAGASSPDQMRENIGALENAIFTEGEISKLEKVLSRQ